MESKAKLILHPVRMKILQVLVSGKQLNVQQIHERLADVPQASLYRHLNKLVEANIIIVVKENKIRGTVEKIYAVNEKQMNTIDDVKKMDKDDHLQLFTMFMTHLLGQFEEYVAQDEIDVLHDGVGFRQARVYLTEEELHQFGMDLAAVMSKVIHNEPNEERHAMNIASIFIPDPKKKKEG